MLNLEKNSDTGRGASQSTCGGTAAASVAPHPALQVGGGAAARCPHLSQRVQQLLRRDVGPVHARTTAVAVLGCGARSAALPPGCAAALLCCCERACLQKGVDRSRRTLGHCQTAQPRQRGGCSSAAGAAAPSWGLLNGLPITLGASFFCEVAFRTAAIVAQQPQARPTSKLPVPVPPRRNCGGAATHSPPPQQQQAAGTSSSSPLPSSSSQ